MRNWEIIAGLIALAAGLWQQLRGLLRWVSALVVCSRRTDRDIAGVVHAYLNSKRESLCAEPNYAAQDDYYYIIPLGRRGRVMWQDRVESGSQMLWVGRAPLWFSKVQSKEPTKSGSGDQYRFSFIRGTVKFEQLLIDADQWSRDSGDAWENAVNRRRVIYHFGERLMAANNGDNPTGEKASERGDQWFRGFGASNSRRLLRWKHADIGAPPARTMEGIALPREHLDVVEQVRRWYRSARWYVEHRIAWRMGLLLHGGPGTGKTTFAREVAADLNMPVHVIDLASMSNEDLRKAWDKSVADAPCMVLLEDVDGVFAGRSNVAPQSFAGGGLTFDCLLNCVDGVERTDGVLLVVTTNKPDTVDPALVRPGRVDRAVEFGNLDYACRLKVAKQILGECAEAYKLTNEAGDIPAAKFSELCCRAALEKLYQQQKEDGGPYR